MSKTTVKRVARATLGARKRARGALADAPTMPASDAVAPGLPAASVGGVVIPPLPVPLLLPAIPTATSVQVEVVDACLEDPVARSGAELLDMIDEVLGPDTEDKATSALGASAQGVGRAQDDGTAADVRPPAQEATPAGNDGRRSSTTCELVTKWTVRNPGTVVPPACNDYSMWTVLQLRKECAERKFRLGRTKTEQIQHLRAYDAAQQAVQSSVDAENLLEARLRKTKHCVVRLLNILCSDQFIQRLISSDDAATRDQIDSCEVTQRTGLWKEVGVHHRTNTSDYNNLFAAAANDPRFDGVDPSYIVEHETAKLFDMWKRVNGNYMKTYAKFFVSGQNSDEFYDFCSGDLDVAYLRVCVVEKPELETFVRGGMHEEDKIDSLSVTALPPPSTKPSKWQNQVLQTVNRIADFFVKAPTVVNPRSISGRAHAQPEEDVLTDRIARLHQLIDQVKESQRKSEQSGGADPALARSISLYQQRLQHYETQLASLY
ncbi:hypothetical protein PF010_g29013 [Phytophthora fragariae]|uniref:SAP domain-containing protein n=2 Tax=Phytophthora fragariae TaxID=53985 RepID=A0A6G0JPY0_9STRA|nr:hypothetical protein PF010_g29013 [Phytophthora fragariae]